MPPPDINSFKSNWMFFPIPQTSRLMLELFNESQQLKQLADDLYFYYAHKFKSMKSLRLWYKKFFHNVMSEQETNFLNHPLSKRLFEIWRENIAGVRRGVRIEEQEQIDFLIYIYSLLRVAHDPQYKETSVNFQNSTFGLKILRPNNQVHIYLAFPFSLRPLKEFIRQYFNMAVITGDYEFIFRRYPPYHVMPFINVLPGQRTPLDSRGMDFPPIIFKYDFKFSTALKLSKIQTRNKDRYVSFRIIEDPEIEAQRKAEIKKKEDVLKDIFPHPGYIGGMNIDDDGKIYFKDEEIHMYGPRRANFLQTEAELNLLKAVPRPGSDSGLIIRFNLLHPIAALLEGINGKRPFPLDEIIYAWKVMDIWEKEARKEQKDRKNLGDIIDDVFSNPNPRGVNIGTLEILSEIERLRQEDPTDEKAWQFLIRSLLESKGRFILQAICLRLIGDVFELIFALWPLITGLEISIDPETGEVEKKEVKGLKKNLLPLLEYLKREMEDLLKNVFSKYLDISAATTRIRSEPILAGLIVEHCLNVKSDSEKFREKLENHLYLHYKVHFDFLKEYMKDEAPAVLRNIYHLEADIDNRIKGDVDGIISLIDSTRARLYSSGKCGRLLCFIDPYSVDVQVGNFEYEGAAIDNEEKFISAQWNRQYDLANTGSLKNIEVEKFDIERKGNKQIIDMKKAVARAKAELAILEANTQEEIINAERKREYSDARRLAYEKLKEGNIKEYAKLSLILAHRRGGFEAVEKILRESPNLVMAIDPHLHHHQEIHEIRETLLHIFKEKPEKMDALAMAMLLSEDWKDIIAAEIHKMDKKTLADILKFLPLQIPPLRPKPPDVKPPTDVIHPDTDGNSPKSSGGGAQSKGRGGNSGLEDIIMDQDAREASEDD